jgi:hypothetical protein
MLNIGELQVQITANTEALNSIAPTVKKLETVIERLTTSIDKLDKTMSKVSRDVSSDFSKISKSATDSAVKVTKSQDQVKSSLGKTEVASKKAGKEVNGLKVHMSEVAKTATVALGPLNGVASRITALTAIANSSAVPIALLLGGLAAFAVITHKSVVAGAKFESSMFQMESAVAALGGQSGMTAIQLNKMAVGLAEATLTSTAAAREAAVALLSFEGVGNSSERVLYLAQDLSQVFGGSLLENTKKLGRIMEDPINNLDALSRSGIRFNAVEKEQIKLLVAGGKAAEASSLILDKVNAKVGGQGVKAAQGLAGAWDTLGERMTAFVETIGSVELAGGSLAAQITEISDTLKKWTQDTQLAHDIGKLAAGVLKVFGSIAVAVAHNIEILTSATVAYAVYGIAKRLIPGLIAATGEFITTRLAAIATGKAIVFAAESTKAFKAALVSTGLGAIAVVLGTVAANYLLFHDNANKAKDGQDGVNEALAAGKNIANEFNRVYGVTLSLFDQSKQKAYEEQKKRIQDLIKPLTEQAEKWKYLADHAVKGSEAYNSYKEKLDAVNAKIAVFTALMDKTVKGQEEHINLLERQAELDASLAAEENNNVNAIKQMIGVYSNLSNTYTKGTKAYQDYKLALANASGLRDNIGYLKEHAKELGINIGDVYRYINVVESLRDVNGFKDLKYQIEDARKALQQSQDMLITVRDGGIKAGIAIKGAFGETNALDKQIRTISTWSQKELEAAASALHVKANTKDVAQAFADLENKTNRTKVALDALKTTLSETSGLMQQIASVKGITIMDRILKPEDTRRLIDFRTSYLKIKQDLEAQIAAPGGASIVGAQIEEWKRVAETAGMANPFAGIDTTNVDAVAQAVAKLKQNIAEMQAQPTGVAEFIKSLKDEAETAGLSEEALIRYKIQKEYLKNVTGDLTDKQKEELKLLKQTAIEYNNAKKAAERNKEAIKGVGDAFANAFSTAAESGGKLSDILKQLENDLLKVFTQRFISAPLTDAFNSLADSIYKGGSSSGGGSAGGSNFGFLGDLFTKVFTSFDGGGYTGSGARVGGIDGKGGFPALIHPQESIVDHTKQGSRQGMGGPPNIYFNITTPDANSFRQSKRQISQDLRNVVSGAGF